MDSTTVFMAQGSAPPLAGESTGTTAAPATPGGSGAPGAPAPAVPAGGGMIWFLLIAMVGVFAVSAWMQRRDKKRRDQLMSAIKKHDRVQTVGGVIGSVVEIKADLVVLKVDESSNTRITFARSAVQQVLTSSDEDS
ncbi:MAG: preprotein translocase subunit YajC [Phycisphaerales bacterium]|nr:preprotein translocase subunit YajC [Phycisphaerales bacterium]